MPPLPVDIIAYFDVQLDRAIPPVSHILACPCTLTAGDRAIAATVFVWPRPDTIRIRSPHRQLEALRRDHRHATLTIHTTADAPLAYPILSLRQMPELATAQRACRRAA